MCPTSSTHTRARPLPLIFTSHFPTTCDPATKFSFGRLSLSLLLASCENEGSPLDGFWLLSWPPDADCARTRIVRVFLCIIKGTQQRENHNLTILFQPTATSER